MSVVTIVEMSHGITAPGSKIGGVRRQAFVDELIRDIPIHPVNVAVARIAGRIEGEQAAQGVTVQLKIC